MRNKDISNYAFTRKMQSLACYAFLIFLAFFSIVPFLILLVNSTHLHSQIIQGFSIVPGSAFLTNLNNLMGDANIPMARALFNSILVSSCVAILTTYFSAMTAFGLYMYQFKGRNAAFNFIMLVMMVPTQVSALGFLRLISGMGMMNTFLPLIIPSIASPIVFFYMYQYMASVLPFEIIESARMDGSNEFYSFNKLVLPIMQPALAVQGIFAFVSSWNNYFMPALILNSKEMKTIPILIAQLRSADYMKFDLGKVYMLICIAIIPLVIVYLILSRRIIRGVTLGAVKG